MSVHYQNLNLAHEQPAKSFHEKMEKSLFENVLKNRCSIIEKKSTWDFKDLGN